MTPRYRAVLLWGVLLSGYVLFVGGAFYWFSISKEKPKEGAPRAVQPLKESR